MKKNILIVLICILIGNIFGFIIFKCYALNNIDSTSNYTKVYLLQIAAFKKQKNVTKFTKILPNYYVEKESDIYHIYIGILKDKNIVSKIEEFYKVFGNNIYIKEKEIDSSEYIKMIETYESIISNTNKKEVIYVINKELLNKYEELVKYGRVKN